MTKTRPALGTRVRVTKVARPTGQGWRKWTAFECDPFEGVITGVRFKANGFTDTDGGDWEHPVQAVAFFVREGTVEVWLVASNLYHDPLCVFPEDCEVLL